MARYNAITLGVLLALSLVFVSSAGLVGARSPALFSDSAVQLPSNSGMGTSSSQSHSRRLTSLVFENPLILPYHSGPILSGDEHGSSIPIYIIWYGTFSDSQRSTIVDFFSSFGSGEQCESQIPTVSSWWKTTESYRDTHGNGVMSRVHLAGQTMDDYSRGKTLTDSDIEELVKKSATGSTGLSDSQPVYFVLTAEDVRVKSFCMNSCGSHYSRTGYAEAGVRRLLYSWVGNSASQCAGRCAWPYAKPMYGPQTEPLVAPNGDVGVDGMVINIATLLAGVATNPFSNGYYQGHALAPLEAATACAGQFGQGAYPGHPGTLLLDESTGASYNAVGANGRRFLLPSLWDPLSFSCKSPFVPQVEVEGFDLHGLSHSEM